MIFATGWPFARNDHVVALFGLTDQLRQARFRFVRVDDS